MKKRLLAVLLAAALALGLAACGPSVKEGRVGDTMKTYFFDFVVESAGEVTREDIIPGEGVRLVELVITVTNTYDGELPMMSWDFSLWWGGREADDDYLDLMALPLDPPDDSFAPLEYTMAKGESSTWRYLFELPDEITAFEVMYYEQFVDANGNESTGDAHFVAVEL